MTTEKQEERKQEFEPFVTVKELSELLQIPVKTIYKWSSESHINGFPTHKIGRHLRFRLSEVDEWLKKYH